MAAEVEKQLTLEGFGYVNPSEDYLGKIPRHPFIIHFANLPLSDLRNGTGYDIFDDGEDRFSVALNVGPRFERMLVVKVEKIGGVYKYEDGCGIWVETRFTRATNRLLEIHFFHVDINRLNNQSDKPDWISLFFNDELDMQSFGQIVIEETDEEGARKKLGQWFALSPAQEYR